MNIIETKLPGVLIFELDVYSDERGFFLETWRSTHYENSGIIAPFVQDNVSFSQKGVLRGLHYQYPQSQGKLVQVLSGRVIDVAVDIRVGSPTFGQWISEVISDVNHRQVYIPPGFAHGYCVTSDTALFLYKCTDYYNPATEHGIIWSDSDLKINWSVKKPVLSSKDAKYPKLKDITPDKLPHFGEF